ncbi:chromatin structure-remodeling complex subunit RSC7 [Coemansia sp. BCRC 34301]|nr:chromatin structure-remodeling complex subunit RSC7 [Coemansia sp. BCRC 34301]
MDNDDQSASGGDGNDSVDELLSKAAEAIRDKQKEEEEGEEEEDVEEEISGLDEGDDDVEDTDVAGEAKISRNGEMLGGREFICPVFRSPYRGNGRRLYVLSMDCCRFTGARDSYMLFKQHPRMKRVETTQLERDLLAERTMIPKVTRFRPIAMISARAAFREFGARLVKDGRYITDDYWEEAKRKEAQYPEGTLVANMSVYHNVMAAAAAGMAPGSTRVSRRTNTPLRSPGGSVDQPPPQHQQSQSVAAVSWVQLEAQQMKQHQQIKQNQQQPVRHAGRTMASALLLGETDGGGESVDPAGQPMSSTSLAKPVFRRMRAAETAEAAFDAGVSAHRAHFDDNGFVDGAPLAHSLAASWTRAPSLANRLKQQAKQSDDGLFGPMAFASARVARDFNASVRMWRDDNGCTWVDPHTGIRQVPAALQPTCAYAQRVAFTGSCTDTRVAFADSPADMPEPAHEPFPLAVLPGQYQASFPVHRTRFGQTQQGAMHSYSYHWMRQLANNNSTQNKQLMMNVARKR